MNCLLIVAMTSLLSSSVERAAKPRAFVLPLQARGGVAQDIAETATDLLTGELAATGVVEVFAQREVEGAIEQERRRQILNCDSLSCAAEIGGALNADLIVLGSLTTLGTQAVLALSMVDVRHTAVRARVTRTLASLEADELRAQVHGAVWELCGRTPPPAAAAVDESPPSEQPRGPRRPIKITALGAGGASLVAGLVGLVLGAAAAAGVMGVMGWDVMHGGTPWRAPSISATVAVATDAAAVAGAALILFALGCAVVGGALVASGAAL